MFVVIIFTFPLVREAHGASNCLAIQDGWHWGWGDRYLAEAPHRFSCHLRVVLDLLPITKTMLPRTNKQHGIITWALLARPIQCGPYGVMGKHHSSGLSMLDSWLMDMQFVEPRSSGFRIDSADIAEGN